MYAVPNVPTVPQCHRTTQRTLMQQKMPSRVKIQEKINYRHVKRINKERKIMNMYKMYRKH